MEQSTIYLNIEQDSQGDTEYRAYFYSPEIGSHQGVGKQPHLAIIALAFKIMEWDQINARSTKAFTAGPANELKKFSEAIMKALNQPTGKWPFLEPANEVMIKKMGEEAAHKAASDPVTFPRIKHLGRLVYYTPEVDDLEQCVLPAIITKEWSGNHMDLQVFHNKTSGTFVRYSVDYCETGRPGSWSWTVPVAIPEVNTSKIP